MNRRIDRSGRTFGLQKASGIISNLLTRKGYAYQQTASELAEAWHGAVGEKLAKQTRANKITGGKLEVTVGNSSVLQELAFEQHKLLKQMQDLLPDQAIKELRFRIGTVSY